jgi:acyl carrier protein
MEDVTQRIIAIIAKSKSIPADTITPESSFDDLQIDSLDKINLTFEVEDAFGIAIPDDSLNSLRTVSDVVDGVHKLLAAKA